MCFVCIYLNECFEQINVIPTNRNVERRNNRNTRIFVFIMSDEDMFLMIITIQKHENRLVRTRVNEIEDMKQRRGACFRPKRDVRNSIFGLRWEKFIYKAIFIIMDKCMKTKRTPHTYIYMPPIQFLTIKSVQSSQIAYEEKESSLRMYRYIALQVPEPWAVSENAMTMHRMLFEHDKNTMAATEKRAFPTSFLYLENKYQN